MLRRKEFVWTRYTGEDFTKVLTYSSEDSNVVTPVNISGYAFAIRFPEDASIDTITASVTNAVEGEMEFSIPRGSDVGAPGNTYQAQLWRTLPSGEEEFVSPGFLVIKEGYLA